MPAATGETANPPTMPRDRHHQRPAEHTRRRYNLIAPVYDLMEAPVERTLYAPWRRELWSGVQGPQVLELGVGTGKNIPYYPAGIHVTAIDQSSRMLGRARRAAHTHSERRVTLLEMDAQELALPDGTFDDVVATFVFCSIPDPVGGLREALRVARPAGRLHLLEHVRSEGALTGRAMDAVDPLFHWLTGVHIARRTVSNVSRAGWKIDEVAALTHSGIFRKIRAHKP